MVDIPEGEQRRIFRKCFVYGSVFWLERFQFDDGTIKPKFVLILNPKDDEGHCHFCLPTSKVVKINSNPILKERYYFIPAGEVECFEFETAINVASINTKSYSAMEQKYLSHTYRDTLKFIQYMPNGIMQDIKNKIIESRFITPRQKLKIFPKASI